MYRIVRDARAAKDDLVRIIDESGEDYLFDKTQFAFVDFPQAVRKKLLALQRASQRKKDSCRAQSRHNPGLDEILARALRLKFLSRIGE